MPRKSDNKYTDGSVDVPLPFAVGHQEKSKRKRTKAMTVIAHGYCPGHMAIRRTAIVNGGVHLLWSVHYVTKGKTSVICRTVGTTICSFPPTDGKMKVTYTRGIDDDGMRDAYCRHPKPDQ